MAGEEGKERERLLDPVLRISEILFGLIMAVTIVGSLSIATAGQDDMRAVTMAALGCNVAWGLVDAVMHIVRTVTENGRNRTLARQIAGVDPEVGRAMIERALPPHVVAITGPAELEGMRRRLVELRPERRPLVTARNWLEALGIFALVVIATFPVVVPFLLAADPQRAMQASRGITLAMLFVAGMAFGRYAGHARPLVTGLAMTALGAALIAAVKALGG